jgi:hypothetical protein
MIERLHYGDYEASDTRRLIQVTRRQILSCPKVQPDSSIIGCEGAIVWGHSHRRQPNSYTFCPVEPGIDLSR